MITQKVITHSLPSHCIFSDPKHYYFYACFWTAENVIILDVWMQSDSVVTHRVVWVWEMEGKRQAGPAVVVARRCIPCSCQTHLPLPGCNLLGCLSPGLSWAQTRLPTFYPSSHPTPHASSRCRTHIWCQQVRRKLTCVQEKHHTHLPSWHEWTNRGSIYIIIMQDTVHTTAQAAHTVLYSMADALSQTPIWACCSYYANAIHAQKSTTVYISMVRFLSVLR